MTVTTAATSRGTRALPPGRYGIAGLLEAEWTKLRSVRSTVWTLAITVVLGIGLSALVCIETRLHWSRQNAIGFDATQTSLIGVFFSQFAIGILGVLAMSAEYGTGTIRSTFAAAPRRPLVLGAKAIVFGVVALVTSELVAFAAFVLGQSLLTAPAIHTTLASPGALRAVVGSGLYLCVLGLFALGLAAIIRHTAGAISAFIVTLLVLPIIVNALPNSIANNVDRFLPAHIGSAIISMHPGGRSFAPWPGLLLLCGYAALSLFVGAVMIVRRDA